MKTKLIETLTNFEKDLIEFLPIAEEVHRKALNVNDIIEENRNRIEKFTVEDIEEIDAIEERIDILCNKISDLF